MVTKDSKVASYESVLPGNAIDCALQQNLQGFFIADAIIFARRHELSN